MERLRGGVEFGMGVSDSLHYWREAALIVQVKWANQQMSETDSEKDPDPGEMGG